MEKVTVKTVELTGTEMKVEGLSGQNTVIVNYDSGTLYASAFPDVEADADNVIEIPAGARDGLNDTHGTVYLLGSGRVELRGTDYAVNFRQPSSSTNGGGGEKSRDIICGTAEYSSGGIKSIPVTMSGSIEESFAAALAAETDWELQLDGVSVLKDGVGFRFVYRASGNFNFVCLVNNVKNGDDDYLDNLQYLKNRGGSYYMDVCYSPTGAVAFGFRLEDETPKLTFMMTKDGNGDSVCMATYYQNTRLEWCKKGDTSVRAIKDDPLRALGAGSSVLGLFKLADGYSGRTFKDCYCVYWINDVPPLPGSVVSIDGKQFAIVYNHIYDRDGQVWLAMSVAEEGGEV